METQIASFRTRVGTSVEVYYRPGTNDWNVAYSCITDDEYRTADIAPLTGVALDVGAHIGAATIALLEANPNLRVIAIEPIPENVAVLRQNTERYGDRVVVIEKAAGRGEVTLHYNYRGPEEFARHHRFIANQHMPAGVEWDAITVPAITLSELVAEYGDIAFLKIDCEGGEVDFLDDAARSRVARIAGEWHAGPAVRNFFSLDDLPPLTENALRPQEARKPRARRLSPEKRQARRKAAGE